MRREVMKEKYIDSIKIILHYLLLLRVKKIKIVKDIRDKNYQCEYYSF